MFQLFSPASPNYTGSPLTSQQGNTPNSQNIGGTQYSPNSPAYQLGGLPHMTYNPTSPVYDPSNNPALKEKKEGK